MIFSVILPVAIFASSLVNGAPVRRAVTKLNEKATAEAQKFDATATRAFTKQPIKTSDGSCLAVDPLSGDFRSNLTPVTASKCDGSKNQEWDVITAGLHNNVAGQALIVSSLTNACLNFDDRRRPGNKVLLFSCGGRADGEGKVADSQQFAFTDGKAPFALTPLNGKDKVCLTVTGGLLDEVACNGAASASGAQLFTIGGATGVKGAVSKVVDTVKAAAKKAKDAVKKVVGLGKDQTASTPPATPADAATKTTTADGAKISVARAGGVLNAASAAEANPRDDTATRAFTGALVKTSDGACLSIDPNAGDFRQNLIPVAIKKCDPADAGQKFDVITAGKHNNVAGQALFVSSLTNGCLNFDSRRAQGDQVLLFSCGGRADGEGKVTDSQQFAFTAGGQTPFALTPLNGKGKLCLTGSLPAGKLGSKDCDATTASGDELFTVG